MCDFGFCESQVPFAFNWIVPIPHPVTSLLRAEQVRQELGMSTAQINDVERVIDDFDFPPSVFQIVEIHRPETEQERDIDTVKEKATQAGIEYPAAIDNESLMWNAWANRIWPSIYLLDKNGYVRYWWYGELNWQGAESEKYLRSRILELIEE
jgi:hypothetical protein